MITLASPIRIGDLSKGITVDQLEIAAISINLQPAHVAGGRGVLSVVLVHPASGWQHTVTYRDASVLEFWGSLDQGWVESFVAAIWDKLQADGKVPAGTVDAVVPAADAASAAVMSARQSKPAPGPALGVSKA